MWHYEAIEFAAAAICGLRAVSERRERLAWSIIALGIASYGCADLYWDVVLQHLPEIPYPSAADAMYLAFYPAAYVGLVLLLRARGGRFPMSVWLDGAIGAVGLAAAVGALVFPIVIDTTGGATMTVVTGMSYPIVDLALLGLVTCVIGVMGWRPGGSWAVLAGGFALFAVADTFYLYQTARGTYVVDQLARSGLARRDDARRTRERPPGPVRAGRGVRALAGARRARGVRRASRWRCSCTTISSASTRSRCSWPGGTLALVIVRLAITFIEYLRVIARSHEEAVSDPLTGLGNRRALASELERALSADDERATLVLFDLDGFKSYNDTFGHPAGDALLERSAGALVGRTARRIGVPDGRRRVLPARAARRGDYRAQARAIAEVGARALSAKGELFEIGCSYGVVVLPDEAATATDAIRLADQRMYARKGMGRHSGTGAAIDALLRAMQERSNDLGEHGNEVEDLAVDLAALVDLPAIEREHIRRAAALHDVGKLAIPDSILQKPGRAGRVRAAVHAASLGDRRAHPRRGSRRRADRRARAREPRALGRQRLPRRHRRQRHPPRGEDHRHLRRLPRDGHGAPVPRREDARGGDRGTPPLRRHAVRSRAHRAVRAAADARAAASARSTWPPDQSLASPPLSAS